MARGLADPKIITPLIAKRGKQIPLKYHILKVFGGTDDGKEIMGGGTCLKQLFFPKTVFKSEVIKSFSVEGGKESSEFKSASAQMFGAKIMSKGGLSQLNKASEWRLPHWWQGRAVECLGIV